MVKKNKRVTPKDGLNRTQRENTEIARLEKRIKEETPASGTKPTSPNKFNELPISQYTLNALQEADFKKMTEIQCAAIPHALAGRDVLGAARTGSGKTMAFIIPVLERLYRVRWDLSDGLGALVISPTRELALQIFDVVRVVGCKHNLSAGVVLGGKGFKDEQKRIITMNLVVATPGRLVQHLEETAEFDVGNVQVLVLDEADRILDLGFREQLNSVLDALPPPASRQSLLFSATQTKSVKALARLSLSAPEYVSVHEEAEHSTPANLVQKYAVVALPDKLDVLFSFIKSHLTQKTLVFLSTCNQVAYVNEAFRQMHPGVPLLAITGKMHQKRRMHVYYDFLKRPSAVLFCTDVASRGLDFPDVDWVLQLDAPEDAQAYIHRSGRTARCDKRGQALLLVLPSEEQGLARMLEQAKVPVTKIKINPNKRLSVRGKLAAAVAASASLQDRCKKAYKSYLRSVLLATDKRVFQPDRLPAKEFALALGLASAPEVRGINLGTSLLEDAEEGGGEKSKVDQQQQAEEEEAEAEAAVALGEQLRAEHREKKNANKKLERLKEHMRQAKAEKAKKRLEVEAARAAQKEEEESSSEEEESDDDDEEDSDDDDEDSDDESEEDSDEDDSDDEEESEEESEEEEDKKKKKASAPLTSLFDSAVGDDEDEAGDLLRVKRKVDWDEVEGEAEQADVGEGTMAASLEKARLAQKKKKSKLEAKQLNMKIGADGSSRLAQGSHKTFGGDDEDEGEGEEEVADDDEMEVEGSAEGTAAAHERYVARLRKKLESAKERDHAEQKQRLKEKRWKEKEKRRGGAEGEGEGGAVVAVLGGGSEDDEDEESSEEDDDDEEEEEESEESEDDEADDKKQGAAAAAAAGTSLESQEELALRLLSQRRR